jgi:single-strand DNA-binding protein
MFSLNEMTIIGNLGKDPETKFTANNISVTTFTVATTYSYKKDDKWENETTWHNVVAWRLSDYLKDALKKGTTVYVKGRLSKREYTDKDGIKRYQVEIIAERVGTFNKSERQENMTHEESTPQSSDEEDLPF